MVLEIWKTILEGNKEYHFIIDTITFSIYTKNINAGMAFFITRKEAEKELKKIKKDNSIGYWLGGD